MITEDKVTEIFCIADDFCKFFDKMMARYTIDTGKRRKYHRESTMRPLQNLSRSQFSSLNFNLSEES